MSKLFNVSIETPSTAETLGSQNEMGLKLFKIEFSNYSNLISVLAKNLNDKELSRSKKYHFEYDRHRFIICRSFLKILLARAIGLKVDKITIEKDELEKPYLPSYPNLFFNVSHSGDYALIALSDNIVGIDVEKIDLSKDYSETIPHIFGKFEIEQLNNASENERTKLFLKFWTRKEAIVKAIGKGIDEDFAKIPATDGLHKLDPHLLGSTPELVALSFDVAERHIGTVAFEGNHQYTSTKLHFSDLPSI